MKKLPVDWRVIVIKERQDVDEKVNRLDAYVSSAEFKNNVDDALRSIIRDYHGVLKNYSRLLFEWIKAFK